MIVVNCEQGSPEWFAAKCGIPSASNFDKIVTTKGDPSKQAQKYMYQLAAERVTGRSEESYSNATMQRGIEMEAEARDLYEMLRDLEVQQVGVCFPDEKKLYAASPDGLVGEDGILEIKCPMAYASVGYLLKGDDLLGEYFQQVQVQLLVTGRKWSDLISYYPGLRPVVLRVDRDEKFITALRLELVKFCAELDGVVKTLASD